MRWRSPSTPLLAALMSGLLLSLCFPPWDRGALLWVWQAPLLAVLWFWEPGAALQCRWPFRQRWRWTALTGWVAGFAFFAVNLFWLRHVAWAGMVVLSLYLALYFALWAALTGTLGRLSLATLSSSPQQPAPPPSRAGRSLLPFAPSGSGISQPGLFAPSLHTIRVAGFSAAAWVSAEWLRSVVFTGFGWNGLGVALHDSPNLRQAADLVGVTGLSFLPAFFAPVLVSTLVRFSLEFRGGRLRPHLDFAAALILLIATFLYGVSTHRGHRMDRPVELSGLLVQGNVPIEQRYGLDPARPPAAIFDLYEDLTSSHTGPDYDLVLWPETCLPATFFETDTQRYLNSILALGNFALLTGIEQVILREDGLLDVYNSMVLMKRSTDSYQSYHKIHRVPFGEFIPFRDSFPIFTWALGRLIPEDFDPGTDFSRLRLHRPNVEIIPSICFEDTIGRLTRRVLSVPPEAPQVIVNVTNDSWFNRSAANLQHLANARFRCIELKRPMIRCANTGISCVIDEFGSLDDPNSLHVNSKRILLDRATGSPFVSGSLPFRLAIDSQQPTTIYARYGDWFAYLMLVVTLAALATPPIWKKVRATWPGERG